MTFGQLKEDILENIGREAKGAAYKMARAEINRRCKIKAMEATVAVLSQNSRLTTPDDFQAVVALYDECGLKLDPISRVAAAHAGGGPPVANYVVENGYFYLASSAPIEDGTPFTLIYRQKQPHLENDDDTGDVLQEEPGLYTYAVLMHHAALGQDEAAAAGWRNLFEGTLETVNAGAVMDEVSGGSLTVIPPRRGV